MYTSLEAIATMVTAVGFVAIAATYFVVNEKRKRRVRKLEQLLKAREEKKSNDTPLVTIEPVNRQLYAVATEPVVSNAAWKDDKVLPQRVTFHSSPTPSSAQEKLRIMRERLQQAN